jgi:glycosyltransferase involved in cell wall biosynthesis
MRACFFIHNFGDGGAQRQCIALLNALQHTPAVEVHLILLGPGEHEDSLDVSALQVHRIVVRNFASPIALAFVARTLRRLRPDVLISWLHPADIWSYAATRVVRGVPWVMTERDSAYPDELVYNLRKRLGRKADAIIANSQQGKEMWESLAPSASVVQIPNIVLEYPSLTERGAERITSVQCLSVGRLEPQKNVRAMAMAFAGFATEQPQARLVVVGKGSEEGEILRIMRFEGLEDRVEFLGFRKDVPELMSCARVLLSLSRHEGMPNVVMEAVAAGIPAVVSDIPQHRALLGDDYPLYVRLDAPVEDAAAVIAQAWEMAPSEGKRTYHHARGVLGTMTPGRVVAAYLTTFTNVIASGSHTTRPII